MTFERDAGRLLHALAASDAVVLLVDEDEDTRAITLGFLRDLGSRVLWVPDLKTAAQVLRSITVDLIVARYDDGRAQSSAAALRACAPNVPIIALSTGRGTLQTLLDALGKALEKELATTPAN